MLVLRTVKGDTLTHDELDGNFIHVMIKKWEVDGYDEGEPVYYTDPNTSLTNLYICTRTHNKQIYKQNNNKFAETIAGKKLWKQITEGGQVVGNDFYRSVSISGTPQSMSANTSNGVLNIKNSDTVGVKIISGDTLEFNASGATTLGTPSDGTYSDGLFPFTSTTKTGDAVDDINEILNKLLPSTPPNLRDTSAPTYNNVKLSFGSSNNVPNYSNVTSIGNFGAEDINDDYFTTVNSGDERIGALDDSGFPITGTLNDDVTDGNANGIPYLNDAILDGDQGKLVAYLNGSQVDSVDFSGSTGSTSSTFLKNISELKFIKSQSGNDLDFASYRIGNYEIPVGQVRKGFNYFIVQHETTNTTHKTNYIQFVYDPDSNNISFSNAQLLNLNLTGSKHISGVNYHTGGDVDYSVDIDNIYRYVYYRGNDAIDFVDRNNLDNSNDIDYTGSGIQNRTIGNDKSLPPLDGNYGGVAADQTFNIVANMNVQNRILGSNGNLGEIETGINAKHPLKPNQTGGQANLSGFLVYNISSNSSTYEEDFKDEQYRVESNVNYISATYANIDGGNYDWDSTKDLSGADVNYNDGLLVFDGKLLYPNSSHLSNNYNINGNFGAVTYGQATVDYSAVSGERNYIRKFKNTNGSTLSQLNFEITHTGGLGDFLTDKNDTGTPTGDEIKFEFLIKRSGGNTHGWYNPFSSNNDDGVSNLGGETSHSGGVTFVGVTLSVTPRLANNDYLLVRIKVADTYSNYISNIHVKDKNGNNI